MLKRTLILLSISGLLLGTMESCFLFRPKNKCDSCPGLVKRKKVKKPMKGSI